MKNLIVFVAASLIGCGAASGIDTTTNSDDSGVSLCDSGFPCTTTPTHPPIDFDGSVADDGNSDNGDDSSCEHHHEHTHHQHCNNGKCNGNSNPQPN